MDLMDSFWLQQMILSRILELVLFFPHLAVVVPLILSPLLSVHHSGKIFCCHSIIISLVQNNALLLLISN